MKGGWIMTKDDYVKLLHELNTFKDLLNSFRPTFTISKMVKDDMIENIDEELNTVREFIKRG